jgi:broad-specificity NMP kinase
MNTIVGIHYSESSHAKKHAKKCRVTILIKYRLPKLSFRIEREGYDKKPIESNVCCNLQLKTITAEYNLRNEMPLRGKNPDPGSVVAPTTNTVVRNTVPRIRRVAGKISQPTGKLGICYPKLEG